MGTTIRKPKALLDAEKRIEQLLKELASEKASKDTWYKQWAELNNELQGIHDILTSMDVREFRDENKYQRLPLSVRLFAWAMQDKKNA